MRSRILVLVATSALALSMTGCASAVSAAKSQVGSAVTAATCTAIPAAKTQLAGLGNVDPATLDSISSAVGTVNSSLAALGDKVPTALKDQLDSAKQQLDDAIAQAKTDPSKAKAALTAAGDKISAGLDQLSTTLAC